MAVKLLISGLPNSGKTSLVKNLNNVFVVARDGKHFPFEIPHINIPDFSNIEEVKSLVLEKLSVYKERFGNLPETMVFDSVSRIFTDIENNSRERFRGFDVWNNVNKEISSFVDYVNFFIDKGINVVIIAHAVYDGDAGTFKETCKGSFEKIGGFLGTVDYASFIELKGEKRTIYHRGKALSRTLLTDVPDSENATTFNLQEYIDKIKTASNSAAKWSL